MPLVGAMNSELGKDGLDSDAGEPEAIFRRVLTRLYRAIFCSLLCVVDTLLAVRCHGARCNDGA